MANKRDFYLHAERGTAAHRKREIKFKTRFDGTCWNKQELTTMDTAHLINTWRYIVKNYNNLLTYYITDLEDFLYDTENYPEKYYDQLQNAISQYSSMSMLELYTCYSNSVFHQELLSVLTTRGINITNLGKTISEEFKF